MNRLGAPAGAKTRSPVMRHFSVSVLAASLVLPGCSTLDSVFGSPPAPGQQGQVQGFLGVAIADEPRAALAGRAVLSAGGNAADAATAMAFTLAVTLPSRAGLGGGGGCLVYDPNPNGQGGGRPEAILFPTAAPSAPGSADRPAGTPMVARGMFALQARYGSRPIESLIVPAEELARFGTSMPRALARDLTVVAGPLSADPSARAVFFHDGAPIAEGDKLVQPELAATMSQLRQAGIGDLYQGAMARRLEQAMPSVGGGLSMADMRVSLPRVTPPLSVPGRDLGLGGDTLVVLPAPFDGGLATAGALQVLAANPADFPGAQGRAAGLAAAFRAGGVQPQALLAGPTPAGTLGSLPASASFVALDRGGGTVVCSESMGNLFGTGRIAPGLGILMSVSPVRAPQPLLAAALVWNDNVHGMRAAAGGSGQESAALAAAYGLLAGIAGKLPASPPDPGRVNVAACPDYLPGSSKSCLWSADPRNAGLAAGSN